MTDPSTPPPAAAEQSLILQKLTQIEARLGRLEQSVSTSQEALATVPHTVATVVDTIDGTIDGLTKRGIDVDARMRRLGKLIEKASEPNTLESLERGLDLATSLPQTLAAAADTFDAHASRLAETGVDIDTRLRIMLQVAERISAPESLTVVCDLLENVDAIRRLLDSGVFGPGAINVVGRVAHALSKVDIENTEPVGLFGALGALNKPDTKRALGVLVAIGRSFGQSVDEALPTPSHAQPVPRRQTAAVSPASGTPTSTSGQTASPQTKSAEASFNSSANGNGS